MVTTSRRIRAGQSAWIDRSLAWSDYGDTVTTERTATEYGGPLVTTISLTPALTPRTHPDDASTRTTLVSVADHTHDVANMTVPPQPSAVAWSRVESALRSVTVGRSMRARRSAGQTLSVLASEPWQAVTSASAAQTDRYLGVRIGEFSLR